MGCFSFNMQRKSGVQYLQYLTKMFHSRHIILMCPILEIRRTSMITQRIGWTTLFRLSVKSKQQYFRTFDFPHLSFRYHCTCRSLICTVRFPGRHIWNSRQIVSHLLDVIFFFHCLWWKPGRFFAHDEFMDGKKFWAFYRRNGWNSIHEQLQALYLLWSLIKINRPL